MSDPKLEEESLISQDDIDTLLDSSSIEEAEEMLEKGIGNGLDLDESMGESDELGELSQDDIDALLTGSSLDTGTGDSLEGLAAAEMGEDEMGEDEMGELSQDDIDSLMGGSDLASDEDAGDDADMELISQHDIDQLMTPSVGEPGRNETETLSDDYVISEADGLDVSACLITQETLDTLILNAPGSEDLSELVVLDEDIESQSFSLDEQGEEVLEFESSSDELEDLLHTDIDGTEFDLESPGGEDVTQEDIDALLQVSDEDFMEDEEDILISQDDIDTLLMAADQEDEDLLGDLMGDDMDAGMGDDFDDEDLLESDGEEFAGGDQVVLAGGDDDLPDEGGSAVSGKRWENWAKSKLVIAAAFVLLVLGISVPTVYFFFFSQDPVQAPGNRSVPVAMEVPGREMEVASVDINVAAQDFNKPGNIILAGFVVLASDLSRDMAYVTADISIDYSDERAYHAINNNLSFYRDLIYESIQRNLLGEKRNEVTQSDLVWGVETSLKKVLPSDYIEKVSFKSFKAS